MSKFAEKVKRLYDQGIWKPYMVRDAVKKGRITQDECDAIMNLAEEKARGELGGIEEV